MEMSNKIGNMKCSSSEEVVAYLYEELSDREKASFEGHLVNCDACTAEFAELSLARLDVYEWHRDEFVEMATPRIVIPYGEAATILWFDSVKAFLGSPARFATAGGAFAVLAIALGVWMFAAGDQEMAKVEVTPTPEIMEIVPAAIQPPPILPVREVDKIAVQPVSSPPKKSSDPQVVKASAAKDVKTQVRTQRVVTRNTQPIRTTAPRLNDFEDEDDNTLRLGDLLAEVDTRD